MDYNYVLFFVEYLEFLDLKIYIIVFYCVVYF